MSSNRLGFVLAALSVAALVLFYFSGIDIVLSLSPQGCRMSWMSPSYILQSHFDKSWSPLADRYSLWLYREVGWESNELHGSPVLFIPGNAGSSRQVRSIASSAARQYYSSPYKVSQEFEDAAHKPLDFFALEFNEDLSAFHGPTLDSETMYASRAIDYILSLYTEPTSITVLGHSMGGIVATALLPHPNISAIITMSTPHTLPPARFDARVDHIYTLGQERLASDPTPILSLCGGATDLMIPSESCIMPSLESGSPYRRTVFTSALEGSWTGVGHREMVWCHQVRWRVARAALEIAASKTREERATVLDRWLRDGHTLPPSLTSGEAPESWLDLSTHERETLPEGLHLSVKQPRASRVYLLPVSPATKRFVLYVSRGSIAAIAPHHPLPLTVSVFLCKSSTFCSTLAPNVLKLIPNPVPGALFPLPGEGTDESEGVVLFEADVPVSDASEDAAIAVKVDGADGNDRGWVVGGYVEGGYVQSDVGTLGLVYSPTLIALPQRSENLHLEINFPSLLSSSLVVYRLTPKFVESSSCADALFAPLLQHTSHPSETHYFPLAPDPARSSPIRLHSHASGPFVPRSTPARGFKLIVYSSGQCFPSALELQIDRWGTLGRWGTRYAPAVVTWGVGVLALVIFIQWTVLDSCGPMPKIQTALAQFSHRGLPWLLVLSFVLSFLPLPVDYWLGNEGEALFAPIAPSLLVIATGLVWVVWWILLAFLTLFSRFLKLFGRRDDDRTLRKHAVLSLGLICLLIFLLIPWQVAFLGCWIFHFYTCATGLANAPPENAPSATSSQTPSPDPPSSSIPLTLSKSDATNVRTAGRTTTLSSRQIAAEVHNQNVSLLVLMTWLLPFAAPVLAVWVRTVATAGWTTPFDGDHNFLRVAPWLVLTEVAGAGGRRSGLILEKHSDTREPFSPRWGILAVAFVAFFMGPRTAYVVLDVASVAAAVLVGFRIALRFWTER